MIINWIFWLPVVNRKYTLWIVKYLSTISAWSIMIMVTLQSAFGQSYINVQTGKGYMLAHSPALKDIQGWPNIFKIDYATKLNSKEYHQCLNSPLSGMSLTYMDHGHPATGKSISLSTFLQPTIANWQKHTLSGRIGLGLSHVQNPFDPVRNPQQRAIGSNLNFLVEGQLLYAYDVTPNLGLSFNSGIIHISNAAKKLPNSGLNIISFGLGLNYIIHEENHQPLKKVNGTEIPYGKGEFSHYINMRGGIKSIRLLDYDVFPAFGLNYTMAYRYHTLGSYTIGLDADYNEGYIKEMRAINQTNDDDIPFKHWRWALAAGHEIHMNRLSLVTQFAVYLMRPHSMHHRTYQRYGLKYQLDKSTVVAATLRAHAARADYMEWTVGRKF